MVLIFFVVFFFTPDGSSEHRCRTKLKRINKKVLNEGEWWRDGRCSMIKRMTLVHNFCQVIEDVTRICKSYRKYGMRYALDVQLINLGACWGWRIFGKVLEFGDLPSEARVSTGIRKENRLVISQFNNQVEIRCRR